MPETIYLDPELAARADALFRELGLDLTTAVQLFLRQALREHGLPFTPRLTTSPAGPTEPAPVDDAVTSDKRNILPDAPRENEHSVHTANGDNEQILSGQENTWSEDNAEFPEAEEAETPPVIDETDDEDASPAKPEDDSSGTEAVQPRGDDQNMRNFAEEPADGTGGELRQAFLNARLIGAPLRRIRSLNRLYSIGEPNDHVQGWREVYVSGDEPFALDFGMVRVELGFHGGGSLRMMDGRLPDKVLEADAVYPRDLSAVFSSVIGQRLVDVSSSRIWNEGREREQLCLRFANGCTLNFAPGGDWGALWLTDAHGAVMFAPEAVWLRVLDDRVRNSLR